MTKKQATPYEGAPYIENIKRLQRENYVTQSELGAWLGIHPNNISHWLSGRRRIPEHHLQDIADYFDVSIYDIDPDAIKDIAETSNQQKALDNLTPEQEAEMNDHLKALESLGINLHVLRESTVAIDLQRLIWRAKEDEMDLDFIKSLEVSQRLLEFLETKRST